MPGSRHSIIMVQWLVASFLAVLVAAGSAPQQLLLKPSDGEFVDLAGKEKGTIRVRFNPKTELLGDFLVFWSEDVDDATLHGALNVLNSIPKDDVFLHSVPAGAHHLKAKVVRARSRGVKPAEPTHASLPSFEVLDQASAAVTIREFEDFVARYRPQPVMPWHRLPAGLDVKMNLAKGGSTACVPETWTWHVSVKLAAFPGTDALPVQVWSEARPGDILASVAKQLGDPGIAESAVLLHDSGARAPSLPSNHATFFAKQQEYIVTDLKEDIDEL